jgi:hypothetical protein
MGDACDAEWEMDTAIKREGVDAWLAAIRTALFKHPHLPKALFLGSIDRSASGGNSALAALRQRYRNGQGSAKLAVMEIAESPHLPLLAQSFGVSEFPALRVITNIEVDQGDMSVEVSRAPPSNSFPLCGAVVVAVVVLCWVGAHRC